MKETRIINLYGKIYRIWEYGGGKETIGYDKDNNPIVAESVDGDSIWDFGVKVGEREYTLSSIYEDNYGSEISVVPSNYAELFAGKYDVIQAICDAIVNDYVA